MVGGGLLSLVKYGENERLCKNFEYMLKNNDVKTCIEELVQENKKRQKEIKKYGKTENSENHLAQYWIALFYKCYISDNQYNNIFDTINIILLNINVSFLFDKEEKLMFCCKKCNKTINNNTIIKNINNDTCVCNNCNKKQMANNKISLYKTLTIEI
jgi:hypothetical protein